MRKVVDANCLSDPLLADFLKNKSNFVVLVDSLAIETYRRKKERIYESWKILSNHTDQVMVLKGTIDLCGLSGREKGLTKRMVSLDQTKKFKLFCKDLERSQKGLLNIDHVLERQIGEANEHMTNLLENANEIIRIINQIKDCYTHDELKDLRLGNYTKNIKDKFITHILLLAVEIFKDHPKNPSMPTSNELINTFIFRFSLCGYLRFISRISEGLTDAIKPEKLSNDLADMNYVATATYFDGFISRDAKAVGIYDRAKFILGALRAR